jgi:hypothetical protein
MAQLIYNAIFLCQNKCALCVCVHVHTHMHAFTQVLKFCLIILKKRDYLEYLSISGRIVLEWFSNTWGVRAWTAFISLRIGSTDCLF